MEKANIKYAAHCLILPFPFQGHINPMLQFAKRLAHKRLKITFAVTKFILKTTKDFSDGSVSIRAISDGFDKGGRAEAKSPEEYLTRFEQVGRQTLTELLKELEESGFRVDCVIYDPFITWVLDVAKGFELFGAAFFTQSCAVGNIYYQVQKGELKLPISTTDRVLVPGLSPLKPDEMPSFIYVPGSYPAVFEMLAGQFRNVDKADWIFVNSFDKLEEEVIDWLSRFWRVKAIGPTIPSMYLDKRLQQDTSYGLNIFKPVTNETIDWLNQQESRSVIYISFGSLAELTAEQTQELAWALETINKPFLWVVRASEEAKLPENFHNEASDKGLIVSWCPQLEVLSHDALGCFLTHCGWNSTLEGLSMGVPLVAMPQWTDQSTNAKFVADVWKVGIRARADEKGLVRREEIVLCVKRVTEGENGKKIKLNAIEWKDNARKAVDEGGSSDRNIEEFVSNLTRRAI